MFHGNFMDSKGEIREGMFALNDFFKVVTKSLLNFTIEKVKGSKHACITLQSWHVGEGNNCARR
jgi:hypothetical protein